MAILQDLVIKLRGFQETTDSEPAAENFQEGSDLFLEINQLSTVEANKEQVRGIVQFLKWLLLDGFSFSSNCDWCLQVKFCYF